MKNFILPFLAYVVLTFVIAATWHLVLFRDIYDQLGIFTRKEPIIPLGFMSMIMQGAVLAWLYPRVTRGDSPLKEGLRFGLLIGVLMASIAVFAEGAKQQVSSLPTWLILESVYYLLQFAVVGVAMAYVYRAAVGKN
jgi:hypothetical protein